MAYKCTIDPIIPSLRLFRAPRHVLVTLHFETEFESFLFPRHHIIDLWRLFLFPLRGLLPQVQRIATTITFPRPNLSV